MIDLATVQRALNAMKAPTNAEALRLLDTAGQMIAAAIKEANGGMFTRELPGGTARQNVADEIAALALMAQTGAPAVQFSDAARLKTAVARAAIETNAVAEGRATLAAARDQLFTDLYNQALAVGGAIIDAAAAVVTHVEDAAKSAVIGTGVILVVAAIAAIIILPRITSLVSEVKR